MAVNRGDLVHAVRACVADGRVTAAEWDELVAPVIEGSPLVPSPESRYVLSLWSSQYEIDPDARDRMNAFLWNRGYRVWPERPAGMASRDIYRDIIGENVGEKDQVFDRYVGQVGAEGRRTLTCIAGVGTDLFHPELGRKGWVNPGETPSNGVDDDGNGLVDDSNGWDFIDNRNDLGNPDGDWHDTHTAGIASEGTDQTPFIPTRVRNGDATNYGQVVAAIEYAISNGARIVNMSWPTTKRDDVNTMRALIARHPDVLFVAAAGNSGDSIDSADPDTMLQANPLPNMVDVAATDEFGNLAGFSSYGGERVLLAARGANVLSTIPGGKYDVISGTSMSSPQVVNAAAKMLVLDPALTPAQLKGMLADTSAQEPGFDGRVGAGGPIQPQQAYGLAALTGLVRSGLSPEDAANRLELRGDERARLLVLAPGYA